MRGRWVALALCASFSVPVRAVAGDAGTERPSVVVVTVDALRADHLSSYGYRRPTTPAIDALLARGARFAVARTPEPLTAPSMASMLTSLEPDVHGASRNALPIRPGLPSLGTILRERGYRTAAFVTNWTLRSDLTGLEEHFDEYIEVLMHKRWWGLVGEEAGADELVTEVGNWMERRGERRLQALPWFLWIHFVDPHAPYDLQRKFAPRLGVRPGGAGKVDRYDTEIAHTDEAIGRLLDRLLAPEALGPGALVVFAADHGESLGEHDYWGHGRHLYEPTVRIPLGIVWPRRIAPQVLASPASLLDVTPTVLGLLGGDATPATSRMVGFDWSAVLADGAAPPAQRRFFLQAHKGAVQTRGNVPAKREAGLLEVGLVEAGTKRVWRIRDRKLLRFDLTVDPEELRNLAAAKPPPPADLVEHAAEVAARLGSLAPPGGSIDEQTIARLKALGYL
ncbi:MAG: sulfatase [Thermoanaerobaculia bacterium]